jgi:transcriptional regulator with GAF, ATPase, and Fis domain
VAVSEDPLLAILAELGIPANADPLAALDAAVARDATVAARLVEKLAARIPRQPRVEPPKAPAGRDAGGAHRIALVARLLRGLNSAASGTAEPLYSILSAILQETEADRGFLMIYGAETLRFELGLGPQGRRLGLPDFAVSTTIVERALESARCVVIPDIAAALPSSTSESARELGLAAALCVPLRIDRRRPGARETVTLPHVKNIVGVLYVDSTRPGKFREEDAGFFEILADAAVLALRVRASLRGSDSSGEPASLGQTAESDPELARRFPGIVTRDAKVRALLGLVERVARSDANVLIRGESGTGKELLARAVHARGLRAQAPFEILDGAALAGELAPSLIFGHEKGAFTGASNQSTGVFERASAGTLFIDHVDELPLPVQASLLRVLQEGEVRRLGSGRTRRVDVRVVAATTRDLRAMVEQGEFRHDLLFRLAVVELRLPPLRERRGDVPLLVRHFLEMRAAKEGTPLLAIENEALLRLEDHAWPGNVRELENMLSAAALELRDRAAGNDVITRAAVDRLLGAPAGTEARSLTMEEIEKRAIEERLELHGWNQAQAAESLGLDRNTLRRKIVRYGIVRGDAK